MSLRPERLLGTGVGWMGDALIPIIICLTFLGIHVSALGGLLMSQHGRDALPSALRWMVHPTQLPGRTGLAVITFVLSTIPQLYLIDLVRRAQHWNVATVVVVGELVIATAWSIYVGAVWITRSRNSLGR
jgi:hypothetical protein